MYIFSSSAWKKWKLFKRSKWGQLLEKHFNPAYQKRIQKSAWYYLFLDRVFTHKNRQHWRMQFKFIIISKWNFWKQRRFVEAISPLQKLNRKEPCISKIRCDFPKLMVTTFSCYNVRVYNALHYYSKLLLFALNWLSWKILNNRHDHVQQSGYDCTFM